MAFDLLKTVLQLIMSRYSTKLQAISVYSQTMYIIAFEKQVLIFWYSLGTHEFYWIVGTINNTSVVKMFKGNKWWGGDWAFEK